MKALVLYTLMILALIYQGAVFAFGWQIVVVSTFGLPALTIPQAIGLILLKNMATQVEAREKGETIELIIFSAILTTIGLVSLIILSVFI